MNDYEALLRGVLENPEDDAPRLVFADYLDDRGEEGDAERASWIRLGIQITRGGLDRREKKTIQTKQELLVRYFMRMNTYPRRHVERVGDLWESRDGVERVDLLIDRGFVSGIRCRSDWFSEGQAKFQFSTNPITGVVLVDKTPIDGCGWSRDMVFQRSTSWGRPRIIPRHEQESATIPSAIFSRLPGIEPHMNWRDFRDARGALSQACVVWGRVLAGLSPLPVPEAVS